LSKRKSISYSQFSQWDKCPWMWKLSYVDRLSTFTDNIHTLFGTSMHEVLQEYIRVMYTTGSYHCFDNWIYNPSLATYEEYAKGESS